MKSFFVGTLLILCIVGYSQTCNHTFIGQIKDFHDNSPITNALIFIKELNKSTSSNTNGIFKLENLCKQTLTLTISHLNCETKTVFLTIENDTFKTIILEHHIEALSEVTVSGNALKKETKTAQERVLKPETLKRYSSLSLGDAIKEVPGVSSLNTGNTIVKPMINGLHSSRVLILNNNVRLQDQEWGIEHAPNIDINGAQQISVIKGSGALAYGGDAIGGVIAIKPSSAILKDTIYGKAIAGVLTNGRGFNTNISLNKNYKSGWFASAQTSLKQSGDFKAPDYNLTNTGLKSYGLTTRLGRKRFESGFELFYSYIDNEIGILRASHISNGGDLYNAINTGKPLIINDFSYAINSPKQEVKHHLLKANYFKRFQNFGKVTLQYDYQNNNRFEFDIRRGGRSINPAVDLRLQTHTFLADVKLDNNLNRKVNFGIMGRYQNNFADPSTGVRRLIPDYNKYDFGIYTTTEWTIDNSLLIDAGLRYDFNTIDAQKFYITSRWIERGYATDFSNIVVENFATQLLTNPKFNYHNVSAALGAKYTINSNSFILGNYTLASRSPNPSELFSDGLHHSASRFEFGDLRIGKEVSNRLAASYNYKSSTFGLLIDGYYNSINDFIYLRPNGKTEKTNRGEFIGWDFVQSNADIYGIDISSTYQFKKHFNWKNKSSFIKGYDKTDNIPLIDIPAFSTSNSINYNNNDWYNFKMSLQSDWVFEQNEFPDFNFSIFDPIANEHITLDISTPPAAYHLLHFYNEMTFTLRNKTALNVAFSINNIFDTNYRNYLNRLRLFANELGRHIILQLQLNY